LEIAPSLKITIDVIMKLYRAITVITKSHGTMMVPCWRFDGNFSDGDVDASGRVVVPTSMHGRIQAS
jgi:hypothetical protein